MSNLYKVKPRSFKQQYDNVLKLEPEAKATLDAMGSGQEAESQAEVELEIEDSEEE